MWPGSLFLFKIIRIQLVVSRVEFVVAARWWVVGGWVGWILGGVCWNNSWCSWARMRPVLGRNVVKAEDPRLASALVCPTLICLRVCRGF